MGQLINLKRKVFGHLEVIRKSAKVYSSARWRCKCSCGRFVLVNGQSLIKGITTSCGCKGRSTKVVCKNCNKVFSIPKSREWREKCCSPECKAELGTRRKEESRLRRTRKCKTCGDVFAPRNTQLEVGQGLYCSQECSWFGLKGRTLPEEHRKKISVSLKNSDALKAAIKRGPENSCFKFEIIADGYRYITTSENKKIAEHRFVAEAVIGRKLKENEVVHHIDTNKLNNSPENLVVLTRDKHAKIHFTMRRNEKIRERLSEQGF
jgi:hypothetical protein